MYINRSLQAVGILLLFLLVALDVKSQESAERITIDEIKNEDTYLAGRVIRVFNEIRGDLIAAAQRISIEAPVSQDVISAGERITVRTTIGDDARLAGRIIHIDGIIGDDLIVAGETITVDPGTTIGGRVWAAGRSIELSGSIAKGIKIAAQNLTINSDINGDVEFLGENIEILPGARIAGNLSYRSRNDPLISADAKIEGRVQKKPDLTVADPEWPVAAVLGAIFVSLLVSIAVIHWVFPELTARAADKIRSEPLKCLGLGLTILLLMPVCALILIITVIGLPLGLILIAIYPVVLFIGFAISVVSLGQKTLALLGLKQKTNAIWRIIGIAIALIVFALLAIIPILGAVIITLLVLGGVGVLGLEQHLRYKS